MFKLFNIDTEETFQGIMNDNTHLICLSKEDITQQVINKVIKIIIHSKTVSGYISRSYRSLKADAGDIYYDIMGTNFKVPPKIMDNCLKYNVESYISEENNMELLKKIDKKIEDKGLLFISRWDNEHRVKYEKYINTKINEVLNNLPEGTKE